MAFESFLDPVLGWALNMPLWLALVVLSLILSVIINLIYKFVTDQDEMKRLKKKIKGYQEEMKEHKDKPEKMKAIQQKAMSVNMKYTMKSMKPTLYTFIPLIIIFAWMNANLAFAPLAVGAPVDVTAHMEKPAELTLMGDVSIDGNATKDTVEQQATWTVSASEEGEFELAFETREGESASHTLVVGARAERDTEPQDDPFDETKIHYAKATPFGDFSIFGYEPGWLMTYIVFSVVFSLLIRKGLDIH